MLVIDASALAEYLLGTLHAGWVSARLRAVDDGIAAPHVIDLEVAQVLRRLVRTSEISLSRAQEALEDLATLPLDRFDHTFLLWRIWELRNVMTLYDAAYISLAEFLSAPLLTRDARLARTLGHRVKIDRVP